MRETAIFIAIIILVGIFVGKKSDKNENPNSRHAVACDCKKKYRGTTLKLMVPSVQAEARLDVILEEMQMAQAPYNFCMTREIPGDAIAFATKIDGRNFIVYDQDLELYDVIVMDKVISHEVGHHVNNHSDEHRDNQYDEVMIEELEADEFAGGMLFRLGYSQEELDKTFNYDKPATKTHPPARERYKALLRGWKSAKTSIDKLVQEYANAMGNAEPTMVDLSKPNFGQVDITSGTLNIRNGPGIHYAVSGSLYKGDVVEVMAAGSEEITIGGNTGIWLEVWDGDKSGYVFSSFLTFIVEEDKKVVKSSVSR